MSPSTKKKPGYSLLTLPGKHHIIIVLLINFYTILLHVAHIYKIFKTINSKFSIYYLDG